MSARQVMGVIIRRFQHLQVDRFTLLRCSETKSTVLLPDDNQNPDGSTLIDASQSRKGVIYVTDSTGFEVYIHITVLIAGHMTSDQSDASKSVQ